ncbi:MAG: PaaX family transcriptional regulator [Marinibacterium sp.]|nr:PaaX family transcriptional regulator [Marinibacterium sp.]
MTDADFARLITLMTQDQTPRVWSLLVTVFGDLAQEDGARISSSTLGHLTDVIGIKPEAMRVALHRLRRDGWIESTKSGRSSHHVLSKRGRAESARANAVIYPDGPEPDRAWLITRAPDGEGPRRGEIAVTPNQSIAGAAPDDPDALILPIETGQALPDWMRARVCDADLCAQSAGLADRLGQLHRALSSHPALSPLQVAALRVLVIHDWRRLILKAPALPAFAFPAGWHGPDCRAHVRRLLAQLGPQDIDRLESALAA